LLTLFLTIILNFTLYNSTSITTQVSENKKSEIKFENMNSFDYLIIVNGCGPENFPKSINKKLSKTFYESCAKHDFDYWLGLTENDRIKADKLFKEEMKTTVEKYVDGFSLKKIIKLLEDIKQDIFVIKNAENKTDKFFRILTLAIRVTEKAVELKNKYDEMPNLKSNLKEIWNEEFLGVDSISALKNSSSPKEKEQLKAYLKQSKRIITLYTYYQIVKKFGNKTFNYKKTRKSLPSYLNNKEMEKKAKEFNKLYNINFKFKQKRWSLIDKDEEKILIYFKTKYYTEAN